MTADSATTDHVAAITTTAVTAVDPYINTYIYIIIHLYDCNLVIAVGEVSAAQRTAAEL